MAQDTSAKQPEIKESHQESVHPAESVQVSGESAFDAAQRRKTILIVDDIAVMRLRLRPQLEDAGYQVLEAEDGEKALELIQNGPKIDLVITDVSMPVMDGLELLRRLRQELNLLHLPVIVCTARGEIAVVRRAKVLGIQGFLVKPITTPSLLAAIRREIG